MRHESGSYSHDDFEFAPVKSRTLDFRRIFLATRRETWGAMSDRANRIQEVFSARNRETFAAVTGAIFKSFMEGATVRELSREYGLTVERIMGILDDERRSRAAQTIPPARP